MAKQKFSPGLDAALARYLDQHHIVAGDVRSYTIHRPAAQEGGLLITLECFVHEGFMADLEPTSNDRIEVTVPGGEPEFIDGAPRVTGEHGPELTEALRYLPAAGSEVRRAS